MIVLSLCICLVNGPGSQPGLEPGPQLTSVALAGPATVRALTPPPSHAQDRGKPEPPAKEAVAAMVKRVKTAFAGKEDAPKLEALRAAAGVPHADVASAVEQGLRAKQAEIQRATVETLGSMRVSDALDVLLSYAKRDRKRLEKDEELHVLLLKAVGRHRSLDALDFLTRRLFISNSNAVIRARIMAVGMIREREAAEALFEAMQRGDRRRVKNYMRPFQLALAQLTGKDLGLEQDRWTRWWKSVPKDWKVAEKEPLMPEELQRIWDNHWGNPQKYTREKERQKRGQGDGR